MLRIRQCYSVRLLSLLSSFRVQNVAFFALFTQDLKEKRRKMLFDMEKCMFTKCNHACMRAWVRACMLACNLAQLSNLFKTLLNLLRVELKYGEEREKQKEREKGI